MRSTCCWAALGAVLCLAAPLAAAAAQDTDEALLFVLDDDEEDEGDAATEFESPDFEAPIFQAPDWAIDPTAPAPASEAPLDFSEPTGVAPSGEATRIFAGPNQFPPENFGAYAIVAFRTAPTAEDRDRFLMICEAYRSAMPPVSHETPLAHQLVTVWPVASDAVGRETMAAPPARQCEPAVEHYDLQTAQRALRDARIASHRFAQEWISRDGPFLIAWNPSRHKGEPDTIILRMDLSDVRLPYQATRRFQMWVAHIESHPELWIDDWQDISFRQRFQETVDLFGAQILSFLK